MPTHRIRRGAALLPGESGKADSSPIYVSNVTGTLRYVPGATGVVEQDLFQLPVVTLLVDGAVPIATSIVKITKGSAAADTLAAPTAAQEGIEILIVSRTAFAHVVTATALIDDGVVGGSKTTMTFGAFPGASILLVATDLKWSVQSKNVVTIT